MTQRNPSHTPTMEESNLPLRDWILLPLIGLLTIGAIWTAMDFCARRIYPVQSSSKNCTIRNDPSTGTRGVPNAECWTKEPETPLVEYRFNSCGHRAGMECGPKPPRTYRIVMIGSSFGFGWGVPAAADFATLLPAKLEDRSGRRIELYNEAMPEGYPSSVALRFNEVLAEQPDLILWVLTPTDIQRVEFIVPSPLPPEDGGFFKRNLHHVEKALATEPLLEAALTIHDLGALGWSHTVAKFRESPSGILLQNLLYLSHSQSARSALLGSDDENGYMRSTLSPAWQTKLREFDGDDKEIGQRARTAGVPLVAVLLPLRGQLALLGTYTWPNGWNPYELDRELRQIVTRNGGIYIDVLQDFRPIPDPERYYFPVDGHPTEEGHKLIAAFLAKELTNGSIPDLKARATQEALSARGR